MHEYRQSFDTYMGVKKSPNEHEKRLFRRAEKYIRYISWIPGLEMVAVVNSLSMFATHDDSDIDLFIVTRPGTLWFVRFLTTMIFWILGVWRHGEDIAGNFCLSFFVTTDAMDMSEIAIDDDIYLYYWIYYMKPVFARGDIYERFVHENTWVELGHRQKTDNKEFITIEKISKNNHPILSSFYLFISDYIRFFLLPRTIRTYEKLGKPMGVIISDSMLKFHDQDRRIEIRDNIFQKNFDK